MSAENVAEQGFGHWQFDPDGEMQATPQQVPTHEPREVTPQSSEEFDEKPINPASRARKSSIAEQLNPVHEFFFVAVICMAQLTTQIGLGQSLSNLHVIGDSFGLKDPGELSWLIAGYSLTVGSFILISGRFGDVFGYKPMLIIGYSWFSIWSMVAGVSVYSNHVLFTFARVFQGIGPSICLPNGLAIFGVTYAHGKRKDMVFAIFGACAPIGAVFGYVFGALFSIAWWPWTFWSFSIALAVTAVACYFVIPSHPHKHQHLASLREKLIELDMLGGLVGVTALILFNFAWNQAAIVGWQKAYIIVTLCLGVALMPAFWFIETRVARNPVLPFNAFSTDVIYVLTCTACGWGCFGIWIYYIWQFWEELRLATPLQGAAWIVPVAISGACASVTTGILLSKLRAGWIMAMALTAFTVGTILIATAPVGQTYWTQTFICTIIIPWGMDMSFPAATVILSNAVDKEHQGIAASLVNTVVNYSISLALGFAGTVEVNVNRGGTTPADVLLGYRGAWYLAIGLSSMGLIVALIFTAKTYYRDWKGSKSS